MALLHIFELITIWYKPAVLQENACKRDREVRVLNSSLLFWNTVFEQLKEINKPRPDGRPGTFWVRTALTDREKLTDGGPAQLGIQRLHLQHLDFAHTVT